MTTEPHLYAPEPRWPAIIAIVAVGGLYTALPAYLMVGPRWLFVLIVGVLLIPTVLAQRMKNHDLNAILGHTLAGVLTLFMVWSVALLVHALPSHKEDPVPLLQSATALWITNILVFALWYWRLDAGGPHARDKVAGHQSGAFLFAQMTLSEDDAAQWKGWAPNFVDYLFLAFNTSTAFSPTDVAVLSRWAKLLTMSQASISVVVVVVLAARAINML